MKEILYIEIPTPDTDAVKIWLQQQWQPTWGVKTITADGILLRLTVQPVEISIFVWSVQRTTYLKMFQWGKQKLRATYQIKKQLVKAIRRQFPPQYPAPPAIDLSQQSIFTALADSYPQTVHFFQKMPNGEYDLNRVYWWEQRWRENVKNPQQPQGTRQA